METSLFHFEIWTEEYQFEKCFESIIFSEYLILCISIQKNDRGKNV